MAVWRRREGWAFAAALGVNVAASLVVWHFELLRELSFNDYWLRLVQANVIASAAVAVVWLAARKRLYELREMTLGESPLLATQVLLPVAGNSRLAVLPVVWLMHTPGWLPPWMDELAAPQGWIGLLLTAAAAAWYLRQTQAGQPVARAGGPCGRRGRVGCVSAWPRSIGLRAADAWIAYHALTTAWAAAGLMSSQPPWREDRGRKKVTRSAVADSAVGGYDRHTDRGPGRLHAFHDPARPWWAAGAILAVSLTAGLVAMLLRKPAHVYFSGLLINLAGTIVWWAYSPSGARWPEWDLADLAGLVQANVLLPGDRFRRVVAPGIPAAAACRNSKAERQPPFAHLAAQLAAAVLLGLVTAAGVAATLCELPRIPVERLDWIALAGIVAATAVCLRDRCARFPLPTLYAWACRPSAWGSWPGNSRRGCSVGRRSTSWPAMPWSRRRSPGFLPRRAGEDVGSPGSKRQSSPWPARWPCGSRSISALTAAAIRMPRMVAHRPDGCRAGTVSSCCWRQSSWRASRVRRGGLRWQHATLAVGVLLAERPRLGHACRGRPGPLAPSQRDRDGGGRRRGPAGRFRAETLPARRQRLAPTVPAGRAGAGRPGDRHAGGSACAGGRALRADRRRTAAALGHCRGDCCAGRSDRRLHRLCGDAGARPAAAQRSRAAGLRLRRRSAGRGDRTARVVDDALAVQGLFDRLLDADRDGRGLCGGGPGRMVPSPRSGRFFRSPWRRRRCCCRCCRRSGSGSRRCSNRKARGTWSAVRRRCGS